ncbi:fumarylacetoacetate hydrolase family protein [Novosphingobium sp.]|uniref:fumarylacetoacetate hydrolase family protein n=1 Tax=Novosphingobium sp. TaxID=1874826 RepID=UPI002628244D|nr:fumarylacetoacetate hydrolase family protein [Novosphingobium sp.]
MTSFSNDPLPTVPSLQFVDGSKTFRPGRIICIGRNYADHALEMGADPVREPPFFFTKQLNAIVALGQHEDDPCPINYPPLTKSLHHEVELVVAIGRTGICRSPAEALHFISGYAVGIDLTRRDMQDVAKSLRRPWDFSKSFEGAAPIGLLNPADQAPASNAAISLHVNGEARQIGRIDQMIWSMGEIMTELSTYQTLASGDLIFTGTPAGVGPVSVGDTIVATIEGLHPLVVTFVQSS